MIKRRYFCSFKKYHDDGKGSFSWIQFTSVSTSFFDQSQYAFDQACEHAKKMMEASPGDYDNVHCIAFNRI